MAQETHNQRSAHAPFLPRRVAGPPNAAYHRVKRHTARRVGLRVEEDFAVHHVVFSAFLQIGIRQVEKILLVPQHRRALIINIQKRLQVVKLVGGAHFFHALIRNGNVIALRDLKHQFGLESAFNVQVKFGFGQTGNGLNWGHGILANFVKKGKIKGG